MVQIRPIEPPDSLEELTELLHRAYARLAKMNLRFTATHQDIATTKARVESGDCFVAVEEGKLVATITFYMPDPSEVAAYYARPGVAHFGQFGVDPEAQGSGIGKRMLDIVEQLAQERGCTELALDTSEKAHHLIELYERWGYEIVDRVQWDSVNYRSVIMTKRFTA